MFGGSEEDRVHIWKLFSHMHFKSVCEHKSLYLFNLDLILLAHKYKFQVSWWKQQEKIWMPLVGVLKTGSGRMQITECEEETISSNWNWRDTRGSGGAGWGQNSLTDPEEDQGFSCAPSLPQSSGQFRMYLMKTLFCSLLLCEQTDVDLQIWFSKDPVHLSKGASGHI